MLAERFGTDRNAADWRRFGRLPGFTNRKSKHRDTRGFFPFVLLHRHSGDPFASAESFHVHLLTRQVQIEQERAALWGRFPNRKAQSTSTLSLPKFRSLPSYAGRPAAADMAFSICALAHGWTEASVAVALRAHYLSRNTNLLRQAAYVQRTLAKAQQRLA